MALPFKSPKPKHRVDAAKDKSAITRHFTKRGVPKPAAARLLLASWNIANLGAQGRTSAALDVIAHILKRFELIAVQEVNEEFGAFEKIVGRMGSRFGYIMSDTAGNNERLAFIYDTRKVAPANLFGELALRPREYPKRTVKVRYTRNKKPKVDTFKSLRFVPFDRNPFIGSFEAGSQRFTLANVHLYFGEFQDSKTRADRKKYARRVLEIYALSRWAGRRANDDATYDKDIILLGDMNVPAMKKNESTYKALIAFGFKPVDHTTKTGGTNLGNDKTYDQMVFAPGAISKKIADHGVFDFDTVIFRSLWKKLNAQMTPKKAVTKFNQHVRHHISDHRLIWVQLKID